MEWISVKTEKPDDLQEVNVTFVNHCPPPYYASIKGKPFTGTCVYFDDEWFWYSCGKVKECQFAPKCGEDTRYNCPLWRGPQKEE